MTDSYSTEDAGRFGMGLQPAQYDIAIFPFFSCNASSKMFHIHREDEHRWVLKS